MQPRGKTCRTFERENIEIMASKISFVQNGANAASLSSSGLTFWGGDVASGESILGLESQKIS